MILSTHLISEADTTVLKSLPCVTVASPGPGLCTPVGEPPISDAEAGLSSFENANSRATEREGLRGSMEVCSRVEAKWKSSINHQRTGRRHLRAEASSETEAELLSDVIPLSVRLLTEGLAFAPSSPLPLK